MNFQKYKFKFDEKKIKEYLIVAFCIGIMLMIGGKSIFGSNTAQAKEKGNNTLNPEKEVDLETRVSKSLSSIKGAGKVDILITYDSGLEKIYAYETRTNETQSKKEESKEMDHESKIAYEEDDKGQKRPVLLKEIKPEPKGAIVIADGAGDPLVRKNLQDAVVVLLRIPQYQVSVFERNIN